MRAGELGLFDGLEIALLPGTIPGKDGRLLVVARHGGDEFRRGGWLFSFEIELL